MESQSAHRLEPQGENSAPPTSTAFEFVQALASELSRGRVELPSYPDVAIRLRQVLADDAVTNDRIAKVIASDAGLAARVLALANSAALSRGGKPFTDLKLAVTRVGHDNVRSAALAYALAQIRSAESLKHIRRELAALWERSTLVAALARVVAIRTRGANPDEALLAGLMHNVGRLYILARADRHLTLMADPAAREMLLQQWQAHIGKAVAQNWGLPDRVADAIGDQDCDDRADAGPRDLLDVLSAAVRTASYHGNQTGLELAVASLQCFQRLGLSAEAWSNVIEESAEEIANLRAALGD